jgi:drug/metabolite transporter (DMT)-like permease
MWFVYALSASVLWGISYAASGRAIERGVPPLVFFTVYAGVAMTMGLAALVVSGKLDTLTRLGETLGGDLFWLIVAVLASAVGTLMIYLAIGDKNATLASLVEISYPVFVALFSWLFFRAVQFNGWTLVGAALVLSGVAVVFLANRH